MTHYAAGHFDLEDAALFDMTLPPPVTLADKFVVPPMSVLDRRAGYWQDRKRRWLAMGIQSELGRDASMAKVGMVVDGRTDFLSQLMRAQGVNNTLVAGGASVFDPVVCELAYRWHTLPGDSVLDPFAGGSVRGVVASALDRHYTGIELRPQQVEANRAQQYLCAGPMPLWLEGDARSMNRHLEPADKFDLIFSCPPYADLERYSDDPRDLSVMDANGFAAAHRDIIVDATQRLHDDRFACWVISDVRDRRGAYRGLVADTLAAFEWAGLSFHNDALLLDPVGIAAAVRAERPFRISRKLTRVHQHLLIFVKGDAKRAAARLEALE